MPPTPQSTLSSAQTFSDFYVTARFLFRVRKRFHYVILLSISFTWHKCRTIVSVRTSLVQSSDFRIRTAEASAIYILKIFKNVRIQLHIHVVNYVKGSLMT